MGLHAASEMWKPKGEKKNMTIVFDDNEDVVLGLKKAMEENKISGCQIVDMGGTLKEALVDATMGRTTRIERKKFREAEVMHASGNYKLSFGGMYGSIYVTIKQKQPLTGKLLRATAAEGTKLKISFVEK